MTTQNSPKSQLAIMTTHAWGVRAVDILPMVPPPGRKLGSLLPYIQVSLPTAMVVLWSWQRLKEQHPQHLPPHFCPGWSPELNQRERLCPGIDRHHWSVPLTVRAAQRGTFRAVVATQWSDKSPSPARAVPALEPSDRSSHVAVG